MEQKIEEKNIEEKNMEEKNMEEKNMEEKNMEEKNMEEKNTEEKNTEEKKPEKNSKRLTRAEITSIISLIAAIFAAIFAGLAWYNAEKSLNYTKAKEAPDLWLKKDVFVWEQYDITQLSQWGQPSGIPAKSIVLQQFPVKEIATENRLNRICLVLNSSPKSSSDAHIDNYSGLFGELHFENRGTLPIKQIEITSCHFKMRENTPYDLEDFDLTPVGKIDVDIERGAPFIMFVGYLFDNDEHRLCDPQYMTDEGMHDEAMQKKENV